MSETDQDSLNEKEMGTPSHVNILKLELENLNKAAQDLTDEIENHRQKYVELNEKWYPLQNNPDPEVKEQRLELEKKMNLEKKEKEEKEKAVRKITNRMKFLQQRILEEEKRIARAHVFRTVTIIARKLWEDTSILAEEHALAADSWGRWHLVLGILITAITAFVGAGIFSENAIFEIIAGILSLVAVTVSAVSTFLNSEQRALSHFQARTGFRLLSNKAEVLVDIDLKLRQKTDEELAEKLKQLTDERDELLKKCPRVSNRMHNRAVKTLATSTRKT